LEEALEIFIHQEGAQEGLKLGEEGILVHFCELKESLASIQHQSRQVYI
jgi:hypothetical protein